MSTPAQKVKLNIAEFEVTQWPSVPCVRGRLTVFHHVRLVFLFNRSETYSLISLCKYAVNLSGGQPQLFTTDKTNIPGRQYAGKAAEPRSP